MSAAPKGKVQEDDCVRRAKASLNNIQLSQVTIKYPFVRRDNQVLRGCPLVPRRGKEARSPEEFVQFHHGKAGDLAQASRES